MYHLFNIKKLLAFYRRVSCNFSVLIGSRKKRLVFS